MTRNSTEHATAKSGGQVGKPTDSDPRPEDLWPHFFPFDIYDVQSNGIQSVIETSTTESGGYTILEGECGTGKTLLSLVSGISLVRSPHSPVERIVVTTNVKQQMEAFENDLKSINAHLRDLDASTLPFDSEYVDPLTSLTLIGKAEICPYKYSGHIDESDIYSGCNTLQQNTSQMIERYSDTENQITAANKLADQADKLKDTPASVEREVDDPDTHPYPDSPPAIEGTAYCPYYSQSLLDEKAQNEPISATGEILTPTRLTKLALERGTCPHTAMKEISDDAEIVIGNYSHILHEPTLNSFTRDLIGQETFLICDEAHELPNKARDSFTKRATLSQLHQAQAELNRVLSWLDSGPHAATNEVEDVLNDVRVAEHEAREFADFLETFRSKAETDIPICLNRSDDVSRANLQRGPDSLTYPTKLPLRDPTTAGEQDSITNGLGMQYDLPGEDTVPVAVFGQQVASLVRKAHSRVAGVLTEVSEPQTLSMDDAGPFLQEYWLQNHTDFFRYAQFLPQDHPNVPPVSYRPEHGLDVDTPVELVVRNCVPASKLSDRLGEFHSGICMSATITPHFAYKKECGLHYLEDKEITELEYTTPFPEENRATIGVPTTKFTAQNRSEKYSDNQAKVARVTDAYNTAIKDIVVTTPGNVLLAGPSYKTAKKAAESLREDPDVSKPVLLDSSSSNAETTKLREEFTEGEPKVLATGMRGTLTEGVDYSGDDCKAIAVFGIPREHTSPVIHARKTAYTELFTNNDGDRGSTRVGDKYGVALPAVRKARQAVGRVIRSKKDVGVRVLLDERYLGGTYGQFLSESEQDELTETHPDELRDTLTEFWEQH